MLGKDNGAPPNRKRKRKANEIVDPASSRSPDRRKSTIQYQNQRRGMLFPTKLNQKYRKSNKGSNMASSYKVSQKDRIGMEQGPILLRRMKIIIW